MIKQAVAAWGLGLYLRLALRTTRWTVVGEVGAGPVVAAFWHENLPMMVQLWVEQRRAGLQAGRGVHVLVSRHRDGRLIGGLMRRFGVGLVHGSSSRGGPAGLLACLRVLRAGDHVVITPDGPRGPRRVAADGVAQLAALAGVPVLPLAARTTRAFVLHSWDRMVLPLPFGRGVLVCGARITVARQGWNAAVPHIAAALTAAADEADRRCRT